MSKRNDAGNPVMQLNRRQQSVVDTLDKNILLLAAAGTGKTNAMACRIAHILSRALAEPEEILCLTFTNKACREMRSRLESIAGAAADRVITRTFHGLCYDIVKAETKKHSDLFADFTIFDEVDCRSILREIFQQRGETWPVQTVQNLIGMMKLARGEALLSGDRPSAYAELLRELLEERPQELQKRCVDGTWRYDEAMYQGWRKYGARIAALYDQRLHDVHGLDFDDLLVEAGRLLSRPEIAAYWAQRFRFIHIDEVQDTSAFEYAVLEKLFGASRLMLAGDFFQTIYAWRGSRPEIVLGAYREKYHPTTIVFRENYRSTQLLLDASFGCLQSLFPERVAAVYPDGLEAESEETGAPVLLKGALDFAEEAQWIYDTIAQLPVKDYAKICILTRNNRYNKALSQQFRHLGRDVPAEERIPFMLIDDQKFFRRQEIKDALAFLRLLVSPHDVTSFMRILHRFGAGIGPARIHRISSPPYRAAGIRLTDYLDPVARRTGDPYSALLEALRAEQVVVFDVEATGVDPTRDEIIQIAGIRLDAEGHVKKTFKRLLHPARPVGDSVKVHKLTDAFLAAHGENPVNALKEFCAFVRGSMVVGHNVTYDIGILQSQLARLGLPPADFLGFCDTLDIYRRFYPNLPDHRLETIGAYCQVKHASSHDAMDDILATAEILLYAVKRNIAPRAADRRQFMQEDLPKFAGLAATMDGFREQVGIVRPWQLLGQIVVEAGIDAYYRKRHEEERIENLRELFRQARDIDDPAIRPLDAVCRFLRYTTLSSTELEALTKKTQIPIITVHQAKGTEFDDVFLAGLQEGTFPGFQAMQSGCLDEEKRLFYVAVTRARKRLFLSWSQRVNSHYQHMSPFIHAIPARCLRNV